MENQVLDKILLELQSLRANTDKRFDQIDERFSQIDEKIDDTTSEICALISDLTVKIDKREKNMFNFLNNKIDTNNERLQKGINALKESIG